MSTLEVDKIIPQSGTATQLGESGDTITIPAGATITNNGTATGFGSADTEKVKVSANDTTAGFLNGKLVAGTNITLTEGTDGGNETLTASLSGTIPTARLGSGTASSSTFLRGDQTYASTTPAAGSITTSQLAYNPNPFRNIIINGSMDISQRGTSQASITSNGYYTADRMNIMNEIASAVFTVSQSTDVPSGQGFAKSMKFDCTTANASPSSGFLGVGQSIEGQNLQYLKKGTSNAESLTLSFWIKSNKTGTYVVELYDPDNNRTIAQSYTISSASTWEKKTLTYAGDTTGALDNDNNNSLRVNILFGAGTEYTSGSLQTSWGSRSNTRRAVGQVNLADNTSNELYITGIQLEAGTTASDFEFLPFDVNEQRCLRYYHTHDATTAIYAPYTSNDAYNVYWNEFPVPMRAAPTITETSSRGWTLTNKTRFNVVTYRDPAGNYMPPNYKAEAEL